MSRAFFLQSFVSIACPEPVEWVVGFTEPRLSALSRAKQVGPFLCDLAPSFSPSIYRQMPLYCDEHD
jgi:hypothetical protein